jgi:hypothetical protein
VLDGVMPQTFIGNHDVTRLASRLTDERHLGHALAVLLTVGVGRRTRWSRAS